MAGYLSRTAETHHITPSPFNIMSTHEITVKDLSWPEVHFSDVYEAQAHLKDIQADRLELQRMRQNLEFKAADRKRYDAAIEELKRRESELTELILDVAEADLFDCDCY